MYNLLVANTAKEWNGDPFLIEIDRCIAAHEHTDKKIAAKYGSLSPSQIDEIIAFPCIFAYETQCNRDPKFGFIREITKRQRQGQVKIRYEIFQLNPFLAYSDFEEMHFELDIDFWEYNRRHWAIKDVDLPKELAAKKIYLPQTGNRDSKGINVPEYHIDTSFSIPGTMGKERNPIIASPEIDRTAVKISCCYAREDEELLNQLKKHLMPFQRQGLIDFWHDRNISPGEKWEQEISKQLNEAEIILLLVSSDFMNSNYCYSIEMKKALERHDRKEADVIPIILRPIYWQGLLGHLQALPAEAKPVADRYWHTMDEAFYSIVEGIYKIVEARRPVSR